MPQGEKLFRNLSWVLPKVNESGSQHLSEGTTYDRWGGVGHLSSPFGPTRTWAELPTAPVVLTAACYTHPLTF